MPVLYVVATPIGNMEDITLRALKVLKDVGLIAAEDTRKTRNLLNRYGITTPLTSYFEHNKLSKLTDILAALGNKDMALVSSAGMPGISDPGYELIKAALENGIKVVPIPGASAVTTALAVSGLPTDNFLFCGFLPARTTARRHFLRDRSEITSTLIILEAPHRIRETLEDMLAVLGDRRIAACRELTKIHEEIYRGTISEALTHFQNPRGEFTLVVQGQLEESTPEITENVEKQLHLMKKSGLSAKTAISKLMAAGKYNHKDLYRAWLRQN